MHTPNSNDQISCAWINNCKNCASKTNFRGHMMFTTKNNKIKAKSFEIKRKSEMFRKKMKEWRCLDVDVANKIHNEML